MSKKFIPKRKDIIELLRSGDFTIAYHDNGDCSLYKGRHNYEDCIDSFVDYDWEDINNGYIPQVVVDLVEALRGKSETI